MRRLVLIFPALILTASALVACSANGNDSRNDCQPVGMARLTSAFGPKPGGSGGKTGSSSTSNKTGSSSTSNKTGSTTDSSTSGKTSGGKAKTSTSGVRPRHYDFDGDELDGQTGNELGDSEPLESSDYGQPYTNGDSGSGDGDGGGYQQPADLNDC